MSLGFVLLMIALDGVIYAFIGYFVARYTNSGSKNFFFFRVIFPFELHTITNISHVELYVTLNLGGGSSCDLYFQNPW